MAAGKMCVVLTRFSALHQLLEPQVLYRKCTANRFLDRHINVKLVGDLTCRASGTPAFWTVTGNFVETLRSHDSSPLQNGINSQNTSAVQLPPIWAMQ